MPAPSTPCKLGCKFCPPRKEFAKTAKNDHAVAIICDTAKSWGHSMIIPFEHSSNLASGMEEKIWKKGIIPLLREVIEKFKKNPQVIGFHINSNAGREAGQFVFHTHIHVVPIYQKDKGNWINFLNKEFTGQGVKKISGWDNSYQTIQSHIKNCLDQKILKSDKPDEFGDFPVWHFNLFAYIGGDGPLGSQEHFWIVPKTGTNDYRWNGGVNCKSYNFVEREKIAERIKNEKWEEEINSSKKDNKNTYEDQEQNQNDDTYKPKKQSKTSPSHGKENENENGRGKSKKKRKNEEETKKNNYWRKVLKKIDNSLEQAFNDEKTSEWQDQDKGPFNTAEGVKKLLEEVKQNENFLKKIKNKYSLADLKSLIVTKTPREVIIIIKRFEYENLSPDDKEIKNRRIRRYYNLKETSLLTDNQINEFCYKVAIGEINENSIKLDENQQKIIKPQKNNLPKMVGISTLILVFFSFLLILFIKKRKGEVNR